MKFCPVEGSVAWYKNRYQESTEAPVVGSDLKTEWPLGSPPPHAASVSCCVVRLGRLLVCACGAAGMKVHNVGVDVLVPQRDARALQIRPDFWSAHIRLKTLRIAMMKI